MSPPQPETAEVSEQDSPGESTKALAPGLFPTTLEWMRAQWLRITAVSAATLIPCFWHREIEAADLGSHLYNAWLVQLIQRGQVSGLWIEGRWNNVLFDWLLSGAARFASLRAAEHLAVCIAVLIFFWGLFALVCAATQRASWYLVPCLAMVTYGWTFEMGFFNYYMAVGLAFFGVAICWRGKGWEWLAALAIAPFVMLAHPLGLFWLIGAGAYVAVAEGIPRGYQIGLLLAAASALGGIHEYLWHRYVVDTQAEHRFYFFNGADQLLLFGRRYEIVAAAFLVFVACALAWDMVLRRREDSSGGEYAIPAQLYGLIFLAVLLFPRGIRVPEHIGAIALLTERLTSVSAALLCCLLGAMRPRKWHLTASGAIAAVFFGFVYTDTGRINRMEGEVAKLVRTLPRDQRVMGTILAPPDWRVSIQHILDRTCIGYCFSYGNYEPGSRMFRVRANPGNPYVLSDYLLAVEMEDGYYEVQPPDLPVYQVYQCGATGAEFCIHALEASEENDDRGVHPDQ